MTFVQQGPRSGGLRRVSPIFLGLVVVFAAAGAALWFAVDGTTAPAAAGVAVFAFGVSGWVISLCLHEYGHARFAYAAGDRSVETRGYLTLDPRRYAHVGLSILLPLVFVVLGGIGLPGGAVYIERGHIPGRVRHSLVSAAGPLANAVFATLVLLPLGFSAVRDSMPAAFQAALAFLGWLQVSATILNLIPVPGLDGYGIVEPWLSPALRRSAAGIAGYGMLIVFGLLWIPSVNQVFFEAVDGVVGWFGIPSVYPAAGRELFQFWHFLGVGNGGGLFS